MREHASTTPRPRHAIIRAIALLASLFCSPINTASAAEIPPDHGLTWRTIGDPGNRATNASEVNTFPGVHLGAVDHVYRLTRTELTNTQWAEFCNAYGPLIGNPLIYPEFTGGSVGLINGHYAPTSNPDSPASMSWEFAARYCNWLCNNKGTTLAASSNGAYDTSTFTRNPDGSANHQTEHNPGAQFWIPSEDEWVKGAYWDPSKNTGEGGYWKYPTTSDTAPITGPPSQGGQTNAGINYPDPQSLPTSVDAYVAVQSPWGLRNLSGGRIEFTSTRSPFSNRSVLIRGSEFGGSISPDRIDSLFSSSFFNLGTFGVRIASAPAPCTGVALSALATLSLRRRR